MGLESTDIKWTVVCSSTFEAALNALDARALALGWSLEILLQDAESFEPSEGWARACERAFDDIFALFAGDEVLCVVLGFEDASIQRAQACVGPRLGDFGSFLLRPFENLRAGHAHDMA